jgi:hypothetical protein
MPSSLEVAVNESRMSGVMERWSECEAKQVDVGGKWELETPAEKLVRSAFEERVDTSTL